MTEWEDQLKAMYREGWRHGYDSERLNLPLPPRRRRHRDRWRDRMLQDHYAFAVGHGREICQQQRRQLAIFDAQMAALGIGR